MNTAEHMTLANPAAWCESGSPGGGTYGVSSSSGFAREISVAGLGAGSGADSVDLASTAVPCCVWAPLTTDANKNAVTNTRMQYVLLVSGARLRKDTRARVATLERNGCMDDSRATSADVAA